MTTTAHGNIDRLAGRALKAARELNSAWEAYEQSDGPVSLDALAHAYDALDRLRLVLVGEKGVMGLLGRITEVLGPKIPKTQTGAQTVVQGLGRVVRYGKANRVSWDQDTLIPAVATRLAALIADDPNVIYDRKSGEINPPSEIARRAVAETVQWMSRACSMTPSRGWRIDSLKALKIDPTQYRESNFGGWDINIERGVTGTVERLDGEAHDGNLAVTPPFEGDRDRG